MTDSAPGTKSGTMPDAAAPAAPPLAEAKTQLARSRMLGRVSAFIFLFAALSVIDGLQTLVRHEFNSIDLIPGETMLVSGMLPADAKSHTDLVFEIEGEPGLTFTPLETYKGFWMGGHMWRAELSAAPDMQPGPRTLTVVDIVKTETTEGESYDDRDRAILFGGRQNPALVHTVTVWASEDERRSADDSLIRRTIGLQPFVAAVTCVLLALAAGLGNWLLFSKAEKGLATHNIFFIHAVKDMAVAVKQALPGQRLPATEGYKVSFARVGRGMALGDPMLLLDRNWQEKERGSVVEVDRIKGHALFPKDGARPGHGWLVMKVPAE